MDRSLMSANRLSAEYSEGVDHFLDFCQKYAKNPKLVLCPFLKCCNMDITRIKEHLFRNDIDKSYKKDFNYEKGLITGILGGIPETQLLTLYVSNDDVGIELQPHGSITST
ncbi:hypothetical protein G4B88_009828 [Cannabis sativa]|uniref:Transposase-associated domain-containing protein n=1 Tax=Cannabis sativa TaxID=3483 RepID=A0A7J6HSF4_CANSA|nr:hypothetical protein G4B88_009828 [Cannabis sativa]